MKTSPGTTAIAALAASLAVTPNLRAQLLTFEYDSFFNVIDTHNANITPTNPSYTGVSTNPITVGSAKGYTSFNWNSGFSASQYLAFSISANSGYKVTVNSVGFLTTTNASGTLTGRLSYSTDGVNFSTYGSDFNFIGTDLSSLATFTQTISSGSSGTIDFHLQLNSSSFSNQLFIGNIPFSNDAMVVNGSVAAVPEPALAGTVLAAGTLAVAITCRKRRNAQAVFG